MSLASRVESLAQRIAGEFNARVGALERRTNAGPVARLHGGLARRDTTNTRLVFLGSSTTEGVGAGTASARYVNRMARYLQGAYPMYTYDDEPPVLALSTAAASAPYRPGVQVINGGIGGSTSADYTSTTTVSQIGALTPLAIVHMIGSNDYANGLDPATYRSNVEGTITRLDNAYASAAPAGSQPLVHVLIHTFQRLDVNPATATYPWSAYRDALQAIAAADPADRVLIDLAPTFAASGVYGSDPFDLIRPDNIHPTDAGYALIAELVADALRVPARAPYPDPVIRDRFTRANATTLGTSETGVAWEATSGAVSVSGGRAVVTTGGTSLIQSGLADLDISAVLTVPSGSVPGIVFRAADDANRWGLYIDQSGGRIQLFRNDAGTNTAVASVNVGTITAGRDYRLRAVVVGDQIATYIDGAMTGIYTMSSADFAKFGSYTKVGIRLGALVNGNAFDNFAVRPVVGDGDAIFTSSGGSGGAPANMVTTDTDQTVTGRKTWDVLSSAAELTRWSIAGVSKALLTTDGSLRLIGGLHAGDQELDGYSPVTMGSFAVPDPSIVGALIRGAASQTADLLQFYTSAGAILAHVNNNGQFHEGGRRLAALTSRLAAAATSTSTTYASTGMSVTLAAGKVYTFRVRGQYRTAATTTGIGFRIGGTCTATGVRYENVIYGLTATAYTHFVGSAMGTALAATTAVLAANTDYGFTIEGEIRVNAAGTLTVDFISEVAGSTVTVQPDTTLVVTEIA